MTNSRLTLGSILVLLPFGISPVVVAEDAPKTTDMTAYLCKDVMRSSDEDRAVALGILHGYHLGKTGATKYEDAVLSKASDDFVEYCLDHPGDKAMEAFGKFVK